MYKHGVDASGWIDLVISRSADLRRAGVLSIGFESCTAVLSEHAPFLGDTKDKQPETSTPEPTNFLDDPASYPDGMVRGFTIHKLDEVP